MEKFTLISNMYRPALPYEDRTNTKVLLVLDVVESVRLMEQDENDFVARWQAFVKQLEKMLPLYGGRIVKSLGDGLMLEFAQPRSSIQAAFAVQQLSMQANSGRRSHQQMHLRMGGHLANFVTDQHDIYGTDVNLTSRVCTLAGPNDLMISAALCSQLTPGVDANVDDLGELYLKHIEKPIRIYRLTPHQKEITLPLAQAPGRGRHKPTVAVIPFAPKGSGVNDALVGEVWAEKITLALSLVPDLTVAPNLPANPLNSPTMGVATSATRPTIDYVVISTAKRMPGKLALLTELIETRTGLALWDNTSSSTEVEILMGGEKLSADLVAQLWVYIMRAEIQKNALPRLVVSSKMDGENARRDQVELHPQTELSQAVRSFVGIEVHPKLVGWI